MHCFTEANALNLSFLFHQRDQLGIQTSTTVQLSRNF